MFIPCISIHPSWGGGEKNYLIYVQRAYTCCLSGVKDVSVQLRTHLLPPVSRNLTCSPSLSTPFCSGNSRLSRGVTGGCKQHKRIHLKTTLFTFSEPDWLSNLGSSMIFCQVRPRCFSPPPAAQGVVWLLWLSGYISVHFPVAAEVSDWEAPQASQFMHRLVTQELMRLDREPFKWNSMTNVI